MLLESERKAAYRINSLGRKRNLQLRGTAKRRHPGRGKVRFNPLISLSAFHLTFCFACPFSKSSLVQKARKLIDTIYKVQFFRAESKGRDHNHFKNKSNHR